MHHTTGLILNSDIFSADQSLPLLTSHPLDLHSVQTVIGRPVKPWTATSSVRISTPPAKDPLIYYTEHIVISILSEQEEAVKLLHDGIMPPDFLSLVINAAQQSGANIHNVSQI